MFNNVIRNLLCQINASHNMYASIYTNLHLNRFHRSGIKIKIRPKGF